MRLEIRIVRESNKSGFNVLKSENLCFEIQNAESRIFYEWFQRLPGQLVRWFIE